MKLLIIRHADPDYSIDSLTEKGWREAELLSERIAPMDIKAYYVSPLGRARDTASKTLIKAGREAKVCDWLQEFAAGSIIRPDRKNGPRSIPWDWLPEDWTIHEEFYDRNKWYENPVFAEADIKSRYDEVIKGLDSLTAFHGYERCGNLYLAKKPSNDTIALFCHFGVECVLLSRLLNISPMQLWHGFCAVPSSVTTVITEERRKGTAYFRLNAFGDTSHLYIRSEPPAFSARFCECYGNEGERTD